MGRCGMRDAGLLDAVDRDDRYVEPGGLITCYFFS